MSHLAETAWDSRTNALRVLARSMGVSATAAASESELADAARAALETGLPALLVAGVGAR